jgi:hypothetical protein
MIDPMVYPALLSLTFGGIIGIISQIQHSKCTEINCCGCYCKRKVPTEEEQKLNNNNNETIARIVENQE